MGLVMDIDALNDLTEWPSPDSYRNAQPFPHAVIDGFLRPEIAAELVALVRERIGPVAAFKLAITVGRLLTDFVELQQVATRKQIQIMSEQTRCPVTKPKLQAYIGEDAASAERYRTEILGKRKSVFNLLGEYPACELPFHSYLEMLSLLAPRYYSISPSSLVSASFPLSSGSGFTSTPSSKCVSSRTSTSAPPT